MTDERRAWRPVARPGSETASHGRLDAQHAEAPWVTTAMAPRERPDPPRSRSVAVFGGSPEAVVLVAEPPGSIASANHAPPWLTSQIATMHLDRKVQRAQQHLQTTLKIAVVAPIPTPGPWITSELKPGFREPASRVLQAPKRLANMGRPPVPFMFAGAGSSTA